MPSNFTRSLVFFALLSVVGITVGCAISPDTRSIPVATTPSVTPEAINAQLAEIARVNQLASLVVYHGETDQWFLGAGGVDSLVPHPASTIKVVIAAVTLEAVKNGELFLTDVVQTPPEAWVDWEDIPAEEACELPQGKINPPEGSELRTLTCYLPTTNPDSRWTVGGALFYMLSESHSSATNTLIYALGGPQKLTERAAQLGYTESHFGSYFYVNAGRWAKSSSGVDWFASSPRDLLEATDALYTSSVEGAVLAQNALYRSRPDSTFGLGGDSHRLGNKIGLISFVLGDIGIFQLEDEGQRYLISAFVEISPELGYDRDYNRIYEGESGRIKAAEVATLALFKNR